WKVAQPNDAAIRGKWWEMYTNADLNALEEQVAISNQNVAAAFANLLSARASVKQARSQLYPTLVFNPSVSRSRLRLQGNQNNKALTVSDYALPLDASWQLDLWGRVRNSINANKFEAQATAADLENIRLSAQAELASDFFELRGQDALKQLF